jgi:hypothetical protein
MPKPPGRLCVVRYSRRTGTNQAPTLKGPVVSDKNPRQGMTKKSGKSLKEKRADKRDKSAPSSAATEIQNKKR